MEPVRTARLVVGLMACSTVLVACNVESGSGTITTDVRDVADFVAVDVSEGISVELNVSAGADFSVIVRYDDNLIDNVVTRLSGATLSISYDGNVNLSGSGRAVEVVMPRLDRLVGSGGAAIVATGAADTYELVASGGASIDTGSLLASMVTLDASGGASVVVFASSTVTGDASGGASVRLAGSPPSVDIDTSGGANVR